MGIDKNSLFFTYDNGKKHKLFLTKGEPYNGDSDTILAASSVAVNGRFIAVFQDGHVEVISRDRFIAKAKEQKWALVDLTPKKMTAEDNTQLKALIQKLGAAKYKERHAAKLAIKKMGAGIVIHLKPFLKHDDFEVQQAVKSIINELANGN